MLLIAASLLACTGEAPAPAPPAAPPGAALHQVVVEAAPLPARFGAALPVPDAEGRLAFGPDQPPRAFVEARLAAGDPELLDRALASAAAAPGGAAAGAAAWLGPLRYEGVDGCADFVEKARATPGPEAALAWGLAAQGCGEAEWVGLGAAVPPTAWIRRAMVMSWHPEDIGTVVWTPAFDAALAELVATTATWELGGAAAAAVGLGAPVETLVRIHGGLPADRQAAFARGLGRSGEPRLRALHCAARGDPSAACVAAQPPGGGRPERSAEALAACARGADLEADGCLLSLVVVDRPQAVAIARERAETSPCAADIARWGEPGSLAAALRAAGLATAEDALDPLGTDPLATLVDAGRAAWFDVETGMYPNQHDKLLAELARTARPDLDGAVFLEEAPAHDPETGQAPGDYVLHAWHQGQHAVVHADASLGDWYDMEAVVLLLDGILAATGSARRATALASGDQTLPVVLAAPAVVQAAVDAGLLRTGPPDAARVQGKAFEDGVLKEVLGE